MTEAAILFYLILTQAIHLPVPLVLEIHVTPQHRGVVRTCVGVDRARVMVLTASPR